MSLSSLVASHRDSVFFNTEHWARSATVTRGGDSITVTAIPLDFEATVQGADGVAVRQKLQQVLIRTSEYTWGNNLQAYPATGDRITVNSTNYEVYRPGTAEQSYEWEDSDHTIFRIHVRERLT